MANCNGFFVTLRTLPRQGSAGASLDDSVIKRVFGCVNVEGQLIPYFGDAHCFEV